MKKLRIIYALLFSMALFLAIPLNAAADFGPKPTVSISFRNADGQTCYSAVLARGSFQPSLGELLTEDAYSDWFGELTSQEQEAARVRGLRRTLRTGRLRALQQAVGRQPGEC